MSESALPDDPDPPEDAELIAYLDGELDLAEARAVEARLARDSAARAKVDAYKKTFDLLDFLPRTEPSPDFATKTLTKLQPVLDLPATPANSDLTQVLVPAPSGSQPVVVYPHPHGSGWFGGVAWLLAGVVAVAVGFFAHGWLAGEQAPPPTREPDPLSEADQRVIDALPLYLGVDNLEFAKRLDSPDLFRPESVSPHEEPSPIPTVPRDSQAKLTALYLQFPSGRQEQLRTLDAGIRQLPAPERTHLVRVLETYADWLDRLPPPDRKEVLSAANPDARVAAIARVKERLWKETLPTVVRDHLRSTSDTTERFGLLSQLRSTELARREEWALALRQWSSMPRGSDAQPWPFSDPTAQRQIEEFLRASLKCTVSGKESAGCRLTRDEAAELRSRYEAATRQGYWLNYAAFLHQLEERHPTLPEPAGKLPIVNSAGLPKELLNEIQKKSRMDLRRPSSLGKWPEYALEVRHAAGLAKVTVPDLGPAKPAEFTEHFQQFLGKTLTPKLTETEIHGLKKLEGKWPEYPRRVMELAKKKDLPVPGLTLPGKPSLWVEFFGSPPAK